MALPISLLLSTFLLLVSAGASVAQSPAGVPTGAQPGGAGLRSGNIAATGQTVPNPQTLPDAARSTVERAVKDGDTGRTDYGICKGC